MKKNFNWQPNYLSLNLKWVVGKQNTFTALHIQQNWVLWNSNMKKTTVENHKLSSK